MSTLLVGEVLVLEPQGSLFRVEEIDEVAGLYVVRGYGNDYAETWRIERTERLLASGRLNISPLFFQRDIDVVMTEVAGW